MLKENKGITLVALVITIIVLLILAGVSISLVVGKEGVVSNAVEAVDATAEAEVKEDIESAISSAAFDCLADYTSDESVYIQSYISNLSSYPEAEGYTIELNDGSEISASTESCSISAKDSSGTTVTGTLTFSSQYYVSVKWD